MEAICRKEKKKLYQNNDLVSYTLQAIGDEKSDKRDIRKKGGKIKINRVNRYMHKEKWVVKRRLSEY